MRYYTKDISLKSCNLTNIATGFGKFRYNIVAMGLCDSSDIFQSRVKIYIYDILLLRKGGLSQYIYHIRVIFARLRAAGLKYNAPKYSFGLNEITYLGYTITREGITYLQRKYKG